MNLEKHKIKYPYQLSGGMSQLVSIGRTIVFEPDFFLLDEPFSSLDYQTAIRMQLRFLDLWEEKRKPVIHVSHHLEEAIFMSDKVVVFSGLPSRIIKVIDIDLPRPRRIEYLSGSKFLKLKKGILKSFRGYLI
jgi:NitT/TauT family transport system ATP-binding protein